MLMERQVKELPRGPSSIPPSFLAEGRCLLYTFPWTINRLPETPFRYLLLGNILLWYFTIILFI